MQIEEVNIPDKKLTLSMKSARADVSAFSGIEPTSWMQGTVQSVSNFGLFVRPAGFDASGKCFLFMHTCMQMHTNAIVVFIIIVYLYILTFIMSE